MVCFLPTYENWDLSLRNIWTSFTFLISISAEHKFQHFQNRTIKGMQIRWSSKFHKYRTTHCILQILAASDSAALEANFLDADSCYHKRLKHFITMHAPLSLGTRVISQDASFLEIRIGVIAHRSLCCILQKPSRRLFNNVSTWYRQQQLYCTDESQWYRFL